MVIWALNFKNLSECFIVSIVDFDYLSGGVDPRQGGEWPAIFVCKLEEGMSKIWIQ